MKPTTAITTEQAAQVIAVTSPTTRMPANVAVEAILPVRHATGQGLLRHSKTQALLDGERSIPCIADRPCTLRPLPLPTIRALHRRRRRSGRAYARDRRRPGTHHRRGVILTLSMVPGAPRLPQARRDQLLRGGETNKTMVTVVCLVAGPTTWTRGSACHRLISRLLIHADRYSSLDIIPS